MPINDFIGETFVAFTDISGFTQLMNSESRAITALDMLYNSGYVLLGDQRALGRIEGLFVSDSGVLFVRPNNEGERLQDLLLLLSIIEDLNKKMLMGDFMLTTSIAYGTFRYQQRIECERIRKESFLGNAYVSAFFDNEKGSPRIQPGQCRLIKNNMPIDWIRARKILTRILGRVRERSQDAKHQYFYWSVENPDDIADFEEQYQDAYNLRFKGMLGALKSYSNYH